MSRRLIILAAALLPVAALSQSDCSGNLHVGYYVENPLNNPEDPVAGSVFLNIPQGNGPFDGEMFFTYVGCQSENVGAVIGTRGGDQLDASWAGTVDGTSQSGTFGGSLVEAGRFVGTYTVDGGKQPIEVEDCISYFIAANGNWSLSDLTAPSQADELIDYFQGTISWNPLPGALFAQCQIVDVVAASCRQPNPVLWQELSSALDSQLDVPQGGFVDGAEYAVACAQFDSEIQPLAFSKMTFVQEGTPLIFADGFETTD